MNDKTLIESKNVRKDFLLSGAGLSLPFFAKRKTYLSALRGVSLAIKQGEVFCVVGESGCGKTTIGRAIMGLLPFNQGEILYEGQRIDKLSEKMRRPYRFKMQMIFQNPYASLNPHMTIYQTLSEPLRILSKTLSEKTIEDKVATVMESVGAQKQWGKRYPHEFSGGQRQRLSIARALMTEPSFIVADEPISALDVSIQAQILNLLMERKEAQGLTYLFITHDLSVVRHFADRVAVMYLGNIIELAPVKEIFARPSHPYTQLLLSAVPQLSGGNFEKIREIGELPNPMNPPSGCAFRNRCPFAREQCRQENPPLTALTKNHQVACHGAIQNWF